MAYEAVRDIATELLQKQGHFYLGVWHTDHVI